MSRSVNFRNGDRALGLYKKLVQVVIRSAEGVYCCCCGFGGCLAAGPPRSPWLSNKLLLSWYWLLSKGIWWTLWTCVFKFPFWEARYGQSWQQNGLSPEEHTHKVERSYGGQRWHRTQNLERTGCLNIRDKNDAKHRWGLLQWEWKKKGRRPENTSEHKQRHMVAFS